MFLLSVIQGTCGALMRVSRSDWSPLNPKFLLSTRQLKENVFPLNGRTRPRTAGFTVDASSVPFH